MHPVIDLIQRRCAAGSRPGERGDGHRVGLAIEGGGMRGLVTSAMATALQHLGLLDAFDVVYGTSAGAFNGAYLLAGQSHFGGTIYYENINNRRFIDPWRALRGQPVMSLEFLVHEVVTTQKPLDWQRVVDSPIPLVMLVSEAEAPRAVPLGGFDSRDALFRAFLATARMPGIAGGPIAIDGTPYVDGGIYAAIPYETAIEDGCTHTLVLASRPEGVALRPPTGLERLLVGILMRGYPTVRAGLIRRAERQPEQLAYLVEQTTPPRRCALPVSGAPTGGHARGEPTRDGPGAPGRRRAGGLRDDARGVRAR